MLKILRSLCLKGYARKGRGMNKCKYEKPPHSQRKRKLTNIRIWLEERKINTAQVIFSLYPRAGRGGDFPEDCQMPQEGNRALPPRVHPIRICEMRPRLLHVSRIHLPMQEMQVQSLGWDIPWRKKWQSTPVFLPGKSHGERNLAGYSPWGRRVRHNLVAEQAHTKLVSGGWHSKIGNSERNDEEMSKQGYCTVLPKISLWGIL